ncbi:hypothetical protein G4B88_016525, partial [Cannabis sativa]
IAEGEPWLKTVNNHVGRQCWEFDPDAGTPQELAQIEHFRQQFNKNRFCKRQSSDLLMRMQLIKESNTTSSSNCLERSMEINIEESNDIDNFKMREEGVLVKNTLRKALTYFSSIQAHDGHWPAECAAGLVFLPPLNEDGGWGQHIEGPSTMFGSVENYVSLRLLGEGPNDGEENSIAKGRKWILDHGGAVGIPSWGKFWLSVLGKMGALARLVYMPMSFLYGKRFVGPITGLVQSLRQELYTDPYHQINWNKARNTVAKEDLFYPHPLVQDMVWGVLYHCAEPILKLWPFSKLREKALKVALNHIHYEDEVSNYLSVASQEKGVGAQSWDAALAVQAIISCNLTQEFAHTLRKAHHFLKASQIRNNLPGNYTKMYRHISKGGWTFNTADQGEKMDTECFYDAVNVLMTYQNNEGGFSAWEPQRGYHWLEYLNPIEFLADTVVERDYVECSSSAIQSLVLFRKLYPTHRRDELDKCISKGESYILNSQNSDVCYTYGTWFGVEALRACGKNYSNCPSFRKACQFLLSNQLSDGGWGESYLSSVNEVYTNIEGDRSTVFNTALAVLALIGAGQEVNGVYMKNGVLNFASYRNIFPIWAIGEYRRQVLLN